MATEKPTVLYFKPHWGMWWLDLGVLKAYILLILLPVIWLESWVGTCYICCCGHHDYNRVVSVLNLWNLGAIVLGCSIALAFESFAFRSLVIPYHLSLSCIRKSYLWWRFWSSSPWLCFLLILMAMRFAQMYYVGLLVVMLIGTVNINDAFDLYARNGQRLSGQCFKMVAIYLIVLVLMMPSVFFSPAFACDCAKISYVKSNMHTLQTFVESYALSHKGRYPPDVRHLLSDADLQLWREFANPFTAESGYSHVYDDIVRKPPKPYWDILGIRFFNFFQKRSPPGLVYYERLSPNKYYIYGTDTEWDWIQNKGQRFYLTNG